MFNGPPPVIERLKDEEEEIKAVGDWLEERAKAGVLPHECGVFVRSAAQLDRAQAAVKEAGMSFKVLDEQSRPPAATSRSAPCTLPKGWSSAPWW